MKLIRLVFCALFVLMIGPLVGGCNDSKKSSPPTSTLTTKLTIDKSSLPAISTGAIVNMAFTAGNVQGATTWTLSFGVLPPGLTMDPNGFVTGTVTAPAGVYPFRVRVVDAVSTAEQDFSWTTN